MAHHLSFAFFLALLFGQSAAPQGELKSSIAFAIRVYQRIGRSHADWMGIRPPAREAVKLIDAERMECAASQPGTMSAEARARFESAIGAGKLFTPSVDGAMFAYVDRDPSVPPPMPSPWGCTDCF